ncbi:hypothetical protein ACT4MK_33720 [Bradyrhizobium barranii]|uniref:hypothetical protein n=1 Tax=Bradyrhizobium TaxID=374 RepID=UPI0003196DEA|nr:MULTISPECIES: hypothetical protein [Bradyrhizobium]MCS3762344.1 hypothetical protein [Bradyrhizobium centrosematis]MCS3775013.1 hypothetical protein [Bradyrhizobium centrosematis]UFW40699.1 hypothetical protein BcanWSM471_31545 [Bradyrhizobium canariense]WOH59946.1 hypothetical protein RX329_07465 [Bradyrhizobium sp. BWC-3-1]
MGWLRGKSEAKTFAKALNLLRMMLNSIGGSLSDASKVMMPEVEDAEDPAAKYF